MVGDVSFDIRSLKGLTQDSRKVRPGYLFAALPGTQADGRDYIEDAINSGASVILGPEGVEVSGATFITDDNPRRRFSLVAAEFYGAQPDYIAAVTGTNGKTSVVHFAQQLWEAIGAKAASLGTLGVHGAGRDHDGSLTTPDPVALHEELAALSKAGVTHVAMEASSHGLDQYRLDGVRVKAAGFTNLSRDHLDYHESMEGYLAAKRRLFADILGKKGVAVLNADIDEYDSLRSALENKNILSYGLKGEALKIVALIHHSHGQSVKLEIMGQNYDLNFPLPGDFQLMNALCALGLVVAEESGNKERTEKLVKALENLKSAPGRLQPVEGHPQGAAIYVDYAHTPDALDHVLKALRPHTEGNLVCLFGCGGDRDKGKRPLMGKAAAESADVVIVTDDNPRSEGPAQIRKDIMEGVSEAKEIDGRREAIHQAVTDLQQGDVLVVAGKGHEQGQIFKDRTDPFDDVEEVTAAIRELSV